MLSIDEIATFWGKVSSFLRSFVKALRLLGYSLQMTSNVVIALLDSVYYFSSCCYLNLARYSSTVLENSKGKNNQQILWVFSKLSNQKTAFNLLFYVQLLNKSYQNHVTSDEPV